MEIANDLWSFEKKNMNISDVSLELTHPRET